MEAREPETVINCKESVEKGGESRSEIHIIEQLTHCRDTVNGLWRIISSFP
jgi:hypothetical protein